MTAKPVGMAPPQRCTICGTMMRSPGELNLETFTTVCDPCTGSEPNVIGIEQIDGARLWAYPPAAGSGTRQRKIVIGYPDCAGCKGKGCQACVDRRNAHEVRKWIAAREARIASASDAVYQKDCRKAGIWDLVKADRAPDKKLREVVLPLMKRVTRVRDRWHNMVRIRLKYTQLGV